MRLRQTIRVPSRYDDECELRTGVSPRRLPRRRKAAAVAEVEEGRAIPYVDYDPNQPPAAFPTLDHPLPAGRTFHSLPTTTSPPAAAAAANLNSATGNAGFKADGHHLDAFDSRYRGIPREQLDNFIASNGPQNPQYKRNMALLAREHDDFDLEISDDDDEQQPPGDESAGAQWAHREEPIPDDPQWSDIPLSLQIEIAENMLETHRLSTIQLLLGLSQPDTEQLTRNLHMQNADLEYENRVLEEMRNKQMQALMCLDNSDLKQHSVPARLVMSRTVWDQCHREIQKQSKMRYLLCQAGDLLLARKFLSKRGLPMMYAGEWDNQFVATPSISRTVGATETLKWKSTTEPQTAAPAAAENANLLPANPLQSAIRARTGVQNPALPTVAEMPVVQLPSTQRHDPMPRIITQQAATNCNVQLVLPDQALVRLKIGPRNAARIHIEQPATPSRRHVGTSGRFLATHRTQTREPNSDDTIEELPTDSDRLDGMHHQYSMPVRRMFGSWPTDASRLQQPESSFSTRPRPGSFNNTGSLTAKPTARQFDHAKKVNTHSHSTLDTARSFDSSPPQPSDSSAMEGVVYGNSRNLTVRNAMPTPAASSPSYTTTTKLAANDNHIQLPETNVEMCLATPKSSRRAIGERQLQSSISAYQRSPMPPSDDTESGNLESASTSFSRLEATIGHIESRQKHNVAQAGTDGFSPSKAMQGLNLLPSASLKSTETAKGQADVVSSFVCHQAQPGTNLYRMPDGAPQGTANSFTTLQPPKSTKYTNPPFGFDSFDIHADNQQASQNVNTSQSTQSYASTAQRQSAADTIGTSKGENTLVAGMSGAGIEKPPSTNSENTNANKPAAKDIPNDSLSPISANVAVDVPSSTRKTRRSARKQTAGTKRDASTEMKAAQPKRGKNAGPTPTPTTNSATNATSTATTNPRVPRGRGRPRKHPIQE